MGFGACLLGPFASLCPLILSLAEPRSVFVGACGKRISGKEPEKSDPLSLERFLEGWMVRRTPRGWPEA